MSKKRIVVLTGAGVSAESGLKTFRDSDGLWEEHRVEDVATPAAWHRDRALVTRFYDQRRLQLGEVKPNEAHQAVARLEEQYHVQIITQNIDNLHERAGSSQVMHLHGRLTELRSTGDITYIKDIGYTAQDPESRCPQGYRMRPNIVWFGEDVPHIPQAAELVSQADILLVIGTSLNVYPAAGLIHGGRRACRIILIDPNTEMTRYASEGIEVISAMATEGMVSVLKELL